MEKFDPLSISCEAEVCLYKIPLELIELSKKDPLKAEQIIYERQREVSNQHIFNTFSKHLPSNNNKNKKTRRRVIDDQHDSDLASLGPSEFHLPGPSNALELETFDCIGSSTSESN